MSQHTFSSLYYLSNTVVPPRNRPNSCTYYTAYSARKLDGPKNSSCRGPAVFASPGASGSARPFRASMQVEIFVSSHNSITLTDHFCNEITNNDQEYFQEWRTHIIGLHNDLFMMNTSMVLMQLQKYLCSCRNTIARIQDQRFCFEKRTQRFHYTLPRLLIRPQHPLLSQTLGQCTKHHIREAHEIYYSLSGSAKINRKKPLVAQVFHIMECLPMMAVIAKRAWQRLK